MVYLVIVNDQILSNMPGRSGIVERAFASRSLSYIIMDAEDRAQLSLLLFNSLTQMAELRRIPFQFGHPGTTIRHKFHAAASDGLEEVFNQIRDRVMALLDKGALAVSLRASDFFEYDVETDRVQLDIGLQFPDELTHD